MGFWFIGGVRVGPCSGTLVCFASHDSIIHYQWQEVDSSKAYRVMHLEPLLAADSTQKPSWSELLAGNGCPSDSTSYLSLATAVSEEFKCSPKHDSYDDSYEWRIQAGERSNIVTLTRVNGLPTITGILR
jgi:hypothetical protein